MPIGILAFTGLQLFMQSDAGGRQRPFDFLGFASLVVFIGGLQIMLDRGPGLDWFSAPEIWIEATAAAIGLWVFVAQTLSARQPFFHRDLARDRNFVASTVFGFFLGVLLFSTTALLPSMMQNLMGFTVLESGYASVPRGLGSMIAFLAVPAILARFGPRIALVGGVALSLTALVGMTRFDLMMTARPIMTTGFVQGMGTGLMFAPLTVLAYATLAPRHRTEGTIVSTLARSLGASVGISLLQADIIRQSAMAHSVLAEHIQPADPVFRAVVPAMMNPDNPLGLQLLNAEVTRQAGMIAYVQAFTLIAMTTLALSPLILMLRPPKRAAVSVMDIGGE